VNHGPPAAAGCCTDRSFTKEHMSVHISMRFHDAGGISTEHKVLRRFGETSVTPASSKGTCPAYASQFSCVSLPNIRQKIGMKYIEFLRYFWLCVCVLKA